MPQDFTTVTELAGDSVTQRQIEQIYHRYAWAAKHCEGKDVIEVACGTGQGLGLLKSKAKSLRAGDYEKKHIDIMLEHYGDRLQLEQVDAQDMLYDDASADCILIFEALYYLPDPKKFVQECLRVLRPGGTVLVTNSNKDLYDFNPSPFSHMYHGVLELGELFGEFGFETVCYGRSLVSTAGLRQRALRGVKSLAVKLGLMPKTMRGKKFLKRLVFGKLQLMPVELEEGMFLFEELDAIPQDAPDSTHCFIYCSAMRKSRA
jgi:SAM-dependent methyltransferase